MRGITLAVPATLKSMSPRKSSCPGCPIRLRSCLNRLLQLFQSAPSQFPIPGALSGTPASISERVLPHTEACDVLPFEDNTSETTRIAYGNSSTLGNTGRRALSAVRHARSHVFRGFSSVSLRLRCKEGNYSDAYISSHFLTDSVDSLRFTHGAKRGNGQHLCLASCEQACPMRSRKDSCFAPDRSDFCCFSIVRSDSIVQDEASDCSS